MSELYLVGWEEREVEIPLLAKMPHQIICLWRRSKTQGLALISADSEDEITETLKKYLPKAHADIEENGWATLRVIKNPSSDLRFSLSTEGKIRLKKIKSKG